MTRTTTFTPGSGVYRCATCDRRTRDDGQGDSVNCGLCSECFTLGGLFNIMQNGGALSQHEKETGAVCIGFLCWKQAKVYPGFLTLL